MTNKLKIELTPNEARAVEHQLRYAVKLYNDFLMHDGWDSDPRGEPLKDAKFIEKIKGFKAQLSGTTEMFTRSILNAKE